MTRGEKRGNFRGKGEGFVGTIIKDTWTITRGQGGNRGGKWGDGEGWGEGRKLYLNNNFKKLKNKTSEKRKLQ